MLCVMLVVLTFEEELKLTCLFTTSGAAAASKQELVIQTLSDLVQRQGKLKTVHSCLLMSLHTKH